MESFDPKPMLTKYAGKSIGETPFASVQDPKTPKPQNPKTPLVYFRIY